MSDITTIVFDLGGVLVKDPGNIVFPTIASFLGKSETQLRDAYAKHSLRVTNGEMTLADAYNLVIADLGVTTPKVTGTSTVEKHLQTYRQCSTKRDEEIIQLIAELKDIGKTVACFTNTEPEIFDFNSSIGLFSYFGKHAYSSTNLHLSKPNPDSFRKLASAIGEKPQQTVFIDDNQAYVQSAAGIGMNSLLYTNAAALRTDLKKLAITVR